MIQNAYLLAKKIILVGGITQGIVLFGFRLVVAVCIWFGAKLVILFFLFV